VQAIHLATAAAQQPAAGQPAAHAAAGVGVAGVGVASAAAGRGATARQATHRAVVDLAGLPGGAAGLPLLPRQLAGGSAARGQQPATRPRRRKEKATDEPGEAAAAAAAAEAALGYVRGREAKRSPGRASAEVCRAALRANSEDRCGYNGCVPCGGCRVCLTHGSSDYTRCMKVSNLAAVSSSAEQPLAATRLRLRDWKGKRRHRRLAQQPLVHSAAAAVQQQSNSH
jgi:hypothetical protein